MFSAAFDDARRGEPVGEGAAGNLNLNGSVENFRASLTDWSREDYEWHWRLTAKSARDRDLLIFTTSLATPGYCDLWVMARDGQRFICVNSLVPRRTGR